MDLFEDGLQHSPDSGNDVVKERELVVVSERTRVVRGSHPAILLFIVNMESLCRAHATTPHTKGFQQLIKDGRRVQHYKSSV